ncbi:MAG: MATE family efflux transporter [Peptococcaceae bacterium]|jgi:putative MATE family efflux protein|nr:MATE family efflux transporter [Peptococcaceae bacterium]
MTADSVLASEARHDLMTKTPIPRLIRVMTIPPVIGMLVTAIFNLADTFFVSKIGTSAAAAVGIIFSLMAVVQAIGSALGLGAGLNISRLLGRGERESAHRFASIAFFGGLAAGVLFIILGTYFLEELALGLGATPTILPYAKDYAQFILFGTPFMISSFVLNHILRSQGNSFQAMVGISVGAILNIVLDPLFIFVFGWGIAGAAIATIIGQIISFFLLLILIARAPDGARVALRFFRPSRQILSLIISNGLPTCYRQLLASLSIAIINNCAKPYGDTAIAALSIAVRICQFLLSATLGFGQGFMPVCGFNYGAGKYGRVRESFFFCLKLAVILHIVVGALVFLFAPALMGLFRREDWEVIRIGALCLRLQAVVLPLQACTIMCSMLLQALGKAWQASVMALSRQGIFLIPILLILPAFLGLFGVQCAQALSDVFSACLTVFLIAPVLREIRRKCLTESGLSAPSP